MPGLFLALRDALGFLVLAVLALSVVGVVWRGWLAVYPLMVALAHDGRTWAALGVALVLMALLKPGGWHHG